MSLIGSYIESGIRHLFAFDSISHIVFIALMISRFQVNELKKVLILLTSFLAGDIIAVILFATDILIIETYTAELAVSILTIMVGIGNFFPKRKSSSNPGVFLYISGVVFALFHSLGIVAHLVHKSNSSEALSAYVGYCLGIEIGQVFIALIYLILSVILFQIFRYKYRDFVLVVSSFGLGIAFIVLLNYFI